MTTIEKSSFYQPFLKHYQHFLGVDEVGRGPLAGPVNSCACYCPRNQLSNLELFSQKYQVTDSKKLSKKKRLNILQELEIEVDKLVPEKVYSFQFGQFSIGECDHTKIDQINILQASLKSMALACDQIANLHPEMKSEQTILLIDGNKKTTHSKYFKLNQQETIVKGDSKCSLISLASIIAKEYRDALMIKLDRRYPGYGLGQHAGYPTAKHKQAIKELGPSPIHRHSFKGVKEFITHENSSL